jgi:hypothetical protein
MERLPYRSRRVRRAPRGLPHSLSAAAAAVAIVAFGPACSSNPSPPQLEGCTSVNGARCLGPVQGGGPGAPGDGGLPVVDAGIAPTGDAATACPGASQIFAASTASNASSMSCISCVATNCCSGGTTCPNDPACVSIASCVATQCLANDQSCLPTCEGAAPTGTVTEYIDFQQCVGQSCPGCPLLAAAGL